MEKSELAKLKKAALSMRTENDTFCMIGENFTCRWNGNNFDFKAPSGTVYKVESKEVKQYIGDGSRITDYCFDYGNQ